MDVICRVRSTDTGKAVTNKMKRLFKKRATDVKPKLNCLKSSSVVDDKTAANTGPKKLKSVLGIKRKSEDALECQKVKRSKIDHCRGILAKLIKHKWSSPFLCPVDVDAAGDYFQVIKHPMDFETIKRKVQQNKYNDAEEFEADVRLIFANATLYHPSNNWVHIYATKLNKLFNILWTPVKKQVTREPIIMQNLSSGNNSVKTTYGAEDKCAEVVPEYSPSKALRIAKLKSRFADTILRAQSKINFQSGQSNVTDAVTSQQEKEKLRQKLEVEVKAAELASRMKAECELKKQRQQEREAAHASLEKMERSIDLDDNLRAMRELEALIGSTMLVVCHDQSGSGRMKSPLEQLGLYIKAEYRLGGDCDDDDLFLKDIDLEDGEIID